MNELARAFPRVGDLFDSPPTDYARRVRVIEVADNYIRVENVATFRKTYMGAATLARYRPVAAEGGE